MSRSRPFRLLSVAVLAIVVHCVPGIPASGAPGEAPPRRLAESTGLSRQFFVGVWETENIEFGRDVRIVWMLAADGSLDYWFEVDGIGGRGSTGTWEWRDGHMYESWLRLDGSRGTGRGQVERIDDNTIRLTILDNGSPEYAGLVRVYRRLGERQLSRAWPQRTL